MAASEVRPGDQRAKTNSNVLWIRSGSKCGRRKNRPEDASTIQIRRMLETCEAEAVDNQNATALALSWAMERKLPRNNLRLIAGTLDKQRDFAVRLQDVEIARAERDLHEAKRWRTRILYGQDAMREMDSDGERLFERYRQAMLDMATMPVFTRADLRRKKSAIGTVWLRAEGQWYDQLRAAVAADEERLGADSAATR